MDVKSNTTSNHMKIVILEVLPPTVYKLYKELLIEAIIFPNVCHY